jgi:hypothetical protein
VLSSAFYIFLVLSIAERREWGMLTLSYGRTIWGKRL